MTSDLELRPDLAPAAAALFYGYTRQQVDLAKRTLMPDGSTDDELHLFLATAQRMGLDPFAHQIRAIRRSRYNSRTQRNEDFISIEPGIDGLRLVAERTHEIEAEYGPYWCGPDGRWVDVWLSEKPPAAAKFGVLRKGRTEPRFAVALWREYRQTKRGGELTSMWENRPAGQLAKCAEALCKRAVFPHELGGIYTSDEMAQADNATTVQAGPAEIDGEPFEDGLPKRWAIENIRDPEDARWLLQQPEIGDDYREAVKARVASAERDWSQFWWNAEAIEWRGVLGEAQRELTRQQSGAGERRLPAKRDVRDDPAPDPTTRSPSTLEPEASPTEADRSRVEGANHKDTSQPGDGGTPPPSVAHQPPGGAATEVPPPSQPPGGPQRSRPVSSKGKAAAGRAPTGQAGPGAFDHPQTSDPGRFTR